MLLSQGALNGLCADTYLHRAACPALAFVQPSVLLRCGCCACRAHVQAEGGSTQANCCRDPLSVRTLARSIPPQEATRLHFLAACWSPTLLPDTLAIHTTGVQWHESARALAEL